MATVLLEALEKISGQIYREIAALVAAQKSHDSDSL
jgi:hypothetical protein